MEGRGRIQESTRMIFGMDEKVSPIAKYLDLLEAYLCF